MSTITRLVELVLNKLTTVHSLRSEILSQLRLYLCFLYFFCVNYCVTNMQIKLSEPDNVFQLTRDHSTMTDVLFGRNLRLKVSLTLWQRNVGELFTYFLRYVVVGFKNVTRSMSARIFKSIVISLSLCRIQDIGVFVDFLPLISKR